MHTTSPGGIAWQSTSDGGISSRCWATRLHRRARARAQQPAVPVVGYFHPNTPEAGADLVAAFRKGLSETGYVEGRNVTIEYAWAHNDCQVRCLAGPPDPP
jgi:hypothetical protein